MMLLFHFLCSRLCVSFLGSFNDFLFSYLILAFNADTTGLYAKIPFYLAPLFNQTISFKTILHHITIKFVVQSVLPKIYSFLKIWPTVIPFYIYPLNESKWLFPTFMFMCYIENGVYNTRIRAADTIISIWHKNWYDILWSCYYLFYFCFLVWL